MEKYDQLLYESLIRYFQTLRFYGLVSDTKVKDLIVLTFLHELVSGIYDLDIDESDLDVIRKTAYCLMGNCIIPFQKYYPKYQDSLVTPWLSDSIFRQLEDNPFSIMENTEFKNLENKTVTI